MRIDLIAAVVYVAGVYFTYQWARRLVTESPRYASDPGAALVSAAITAVLWPVVMPLHLIGVMRRKLGWLTDFEKKRLK